MEEKLHGLQHVIRSCVAYGVTLSLRYIPFLNEKNEMPKLECAIQKLVNLKSSSKVTDCETTNFTKSQDRRSYEPYNQHATWACHLVLRKGTDEVCGETDAST